MAEKLCALKKKGGGELKETTLWTNSSPTSSFAGSITLPDITPYKLIKVTFRVSTSNSNEYYVLYTPDQLLNAIYVAPGSGQVLTLGFFTGSARYLRYFRAKSATSISFSNCLLVGQSDTYNNYIIPIKITGLK